MRLSSTDKIIEFFLCQWGCQSLQALVRLLTSLPRTQYLLQLTPCPSSSSSWLHWQPQSSWSSPSSPAAGGGSSGETGRGEIKKRGTAVYISVTTFLVLTPSVSPQSDGDPDAERSSIRAPAGSTPPQPHVPAGSPAAELKAAGPRVSPK